MQWNINHKREWIWVRSSEVDEPRASYTEWSKSEREKQISYQLSSVAQSCPTLCDPMNRSTESRKGSWRTHLQSRNMDADLEKSLVDTAGKGWDGMNWKMHGNTYAIMCKAVWSCCVTRGTRSGALWGPGGVGWGWQRFKRQGIYIHLWVTHIVCRNQHNIVTQLYSN